jgi:hypothetical protein
MSDPLLHALIAHVDSVFVGPNGDYAAVLEAISGVSAGQALWRPTPAHNSIWRIVEHLIASKQWLIEMLEHGKAASPVWIEPAGDEADWQATIVRLKDAHQHLKLALEHEADADLLQVPSAEERCTLLELILSAGPAHDAHHGGQLDYLKGLQVR